MTENQITDTILRGEVTGKVRTLRGFMTYHHEPVESNSAAEHFIRLVGSPEVADRAAELFDQIRRGFSYKRKEIALTCDEGAASIKTPDFDLALTLTQDPVTPTNYRLTTELSAFRRQEILHVEAFSTLFNTHCDTVVLVFGKPIDLEAKIDRIEENDQLAEFLDYDAACSWFTLRLPLLHIEVTRLQMLFRLSGQRDLSRLISETQTALAQLAGAGLSLERAD